MAATLTKQFKVVRWKLAQACIEWGISHPVLSKRLHHLGIDVGDDGCFSTKQICTAVYGDKQAEQARLVREQADKAEIGNKLARHELCYIDRVANLFVGKCTAIRQMIQANPNLEQKDKDDLCNELAELVLDGSILDEICSSEDS